MILSNCDALQEQAISFGMLPNTRPEFNFAYVFDFLDMQIFCLKIVPFYDSKLKTVSNYKTAFSLFPRQSFDILSLERTFYINHLFFKKKPILWGSAVWS